MDEIVQFRLMLRHIQQLIFGKSTDKYGNYAWQLSSIFVGFGKLNRFFHIFECVGFKVLQWNLGSLGNSGNNINRIEADWVLQYAWEIVSNDGVIGHFDKEADSHKRIIFDQQVQILTADVKTQHSVWLSLKATVNFSCLVFSQMMV